MVIYTLVRAHDQDRAVGVANDGIRDATHEGTSDTTETPTTHHYQAGAEFVGQVYDRLVSPFSRSEMSSRDGTPDLFDFPHLLVEYVLSVLPDRFERFLIAFPTEAHFVRRVDRIRPPWGSGNDV